MCKNIKPYMELAELKIKSVAGVESGEVDDLERANAEVAGMSASEVIRWAVCGRGLGRVVVSTNFRPYEGVVLHLAVGEQSGMPVLWVDHGHTREATDRFAGLLTGRLGLDLRRFEPLGSVAIPAAVHVPEDERTPEDDERIHEFSEKVKLEPFRRGMAELGPEVWITGLRRVQNPNRETMRVVEAGPGGVLKVNPILEWSDQDMENHLAEHDLPNEWDYFDPAKAGEKRECGLHTRMA